MPYELPPNFYEVKINEAQTMAATPRFAPVAPGKEPWWLEIERLKRERDEAQGIVLACHRAFIGGSSFCQSEARRLAAELVRKLSPPKQDVELPLRENNHP